MNIKKIIGAINEGILDGINDLDDELLIRKRDKEVVNQHMHNNIKKHVIFNTLNIKQFKCLLNDQYKNNVLLKYFKFNFDKEYSILYKSQYNPYINDKMVISLNTNNWTQIIEFEYDPIPQYFMHLYYYEYDDKKSLEKSFEEQPKVFKEKIKNNCKGCDYLTYFKNHIMEAETARLSKFGINLNTLCNIYLNIKNSCANLKEVKDNAVISNIYISPDKNFYYAFIRNTYINSLQIFGIIDIDKIEIDKLDNIEGSSNENNNREYNKIKKNFYKEYSSSIPSQFYNDNLNGIKCLSFTIKSAADTSDYSSYLNSIKTDYMLIAPKKIQDFYLKHIFYNSLYYINNIDLKNKLEEDENNQNIKVILTDIHAKFIYVIKIFKKNYLKFSTLSIIDNTDESVISIKDAVNSFKTKQTWRGFTRSSY